MGACSATMEESTRGIRDQEASIPDAARFRQYAEEALRWADQSKTERERRVLIELADAWTQAAIESEKPVVVHYSSPQYRIP
jgi:hypothetical protein